MIAARRLKELRQAVRKWVSEGLLTGTVGRIVVLVVKPSGHRDAFAQTIEYVLEIAGAANQMARLR